MPVPFQCGECGFKSQVKDELQGKKIKCPKCQAVGTAGELPKTKAKAKAKAGGGSDDPFDNLMNMDLDALEEEDLGAVGERGYRDPDEKPKKKKDKKAQDKPAQGVSSGAMAGVVICLIAAAGIVAAGVYFVLPKILEGQNANSTDGAQADPSTQQSSSTDASGQTSDAAQAEPAP